MDKLPTETVRVIAELIDREDILSLRLTCRSFAALGLPRQFEVIPVMLFRNSLENLLRISEHSVYRNYVLTIKYGGELVSNPKTRIAWTKNEFLLPGAPKKTFSESEVEEACTCAKFQLFVIDAYANERRRPKPRPVLQ